MRPLVLFLLIGFVLYDKSQGQTKSSNNLGKDFYDEGISSAKANSDRIELTNVTYSIESLDIDDELGNYLVKETHRSITDWDDYKDSKITLDIFALKNGQLIRTIKKNADKISFSTQFIESIKYGCCAEENYNELSSLSTNETFLKFSEKYYTIEIPSSQYSQIHLYLGFLSQARDENKWILGELYFAQALPIITQGKGYYYSLTFKSVNKIIFKACTKELFNRIEFGSPEMTLVKNKDNDVLYDSPEVHTLFLNSFDKVKSLTGVNFLGMKIRFWEGDSIFTTPIEIPIIDGFLFGDSSAERTIYVDK